jgi:hypothetical protein
MGFPNAYVSRCVDNQATKQRSFWAIQSA